MSFSPANVPGLIADWNVDNVVGSTNASSLPDSSGNSNTLLQATGSAQPAIVSADPDFNGHKSLQGATGCYMRIAALTGGLLAQPFTKYAVIKTSSNVTTTQDILSGASGASNRGDMILGGTGRISAYAGTQLNGPAASVAINTIGIAKVVLNNTSSLTEWRPRGGSVASNTGAAGTQTLGGTTLFGLGAGTNPFLGKGPRFLIYSGIPDSTQDALLIQYLEQVYLVRASTGAVFVFLSAFGSGNSHANAGGSAGCGIVASAVGRSTAMAIAATDVGVSSSGVGSSEAKSSSVVDVTIDAAADGQAIFPATGSVDVDVSSAATTLTAVRATGSEAIDIEASGISYPMLPTTPPVVTAIVDENQPVILEWIDDGPAILEWVAE
jgi:hypothetical protein